MSKSKQGFKAVHRKNCSSIGSWRNGNFYCKCFRKRGWFFHFLALPFAINRSNLCETFLMRIFGRFFEQTDSQAIAASGALLIDNYHEKEEGGREKGANETQIYFLHCYFPKCVFLFCLHIYCKRVSGTTSALSNRYTRMYAFRACARKSTSETSATRSSSARQRRTCSPAEAFLRRVKKHS